jgi:dGTP triphosphohydrolase
MEERFLFLCNNILDFIFSPPVNYTSVLSIINHYLGKEITISQEQFNYIRKKTIFFIESFESTRLAIHFIDEVTDKDIYFRENMAYAEKEYFKVIQEIEELQKYLKNIRDTYWVTITYSPEIPENHLKGTRWIRYLFDVYLKYGGRRYVTSIEFFNSMKDMWAKLTDEETIEIGYITDKISIDIISYNLNNWLNNNITSIDNRHKNIIKLMV